MYYSDNFNENKTPIKVVGHKRASDTLLVSKLKVGFQVISP